MARVEDEVKKTRQKLGGLCGCKKVYKDPTSHQRAKGTQGWLQGPAKRL